MRAFTKVSVLLLSCSPMALAMRPLSSSTPQGGPQQPRISYIDQGWGDDVREEFHFATQGSELIPYYWFLNLTESDGTTLLKDDLEQFGVLYDDVTPDPAHLNPDNLPIGFVRKDETRSYGKGIEEKHWLGLTCAACHTGAIIPPPTPTRPHPGMVVIDGAPTNTNMGAFLTKLQEAVQATDDQPARLRILAQKVFDAGDGDSISDIEARFKAYATQLNTIVPLYVPHTVAGPGRLDCFGGIFNRVCVYDIESNQSPPAGLNAPVDFPFIWYTDRQSQIQWNGLVGNGTWIARLARNAGEVTGVFAQYSVTTTPPLHFPAFESSVDVFGLGSIDTWLNRLNPPKWTDVFPDADPAAAAKRMAAMKQGQTVFQQNCQIGSCHPDVAAEGAMGNAEPTPLKQGPDNPDELPDLGTDPNNTLLVHATISDTGILSGSAKSLAGKPPVEAKGVLDVLVIGALLKAWEDVVAAYAEHFFHVDYKMAGVAERAAIQAKVLRALSKRSIQSHHLFNEPNGANAGGETSPEYMYGYESRSLNGIWATAPYLHNGSVPNLVELLWPEKRKAFYVGSRVYDPTSVGFVCDGSQGGVLFDTHLPGNSNSGHIYGAKLSDDQKWDLIEYLKNL